jgi:hypothetical protein
VDKHLVVVSCCFVAFGWVFSGSMVKESCCDCLPNFSVFLIWTKATGNYRQFESIHNGEKLFADVSSSLYGTGLDEIVITPLGVASVMLPRFIDCKHGEVIAIFVVEARTFLIS